MERERASERERGRERERERERARDKERERKREIYMAAVRRRKLDTHNIYTYSHMYGGNT